MPTSRIGICHICGIKGPLSFEHVPPKSAFNDRAVVLVEFEKALNLGPNDPTPRGVVQQRGAGGFTLCERCNSSTGGWYGNQFAAFCYQAAEHLMQTQGKPTIYFPYYIQPLAVLKQIVTMFMSVNSERFREVHPQLEKFVLNKHRKYLDPKYRFFLYYNVEGRPRSQGVSAKMNVFKGRMSILSEITFPPFGYVMVLEGDPPEDVVEITHFSRFDYNDLRMVQLMLPVLPTHLIFPGDYRSRDEIYEQVMRSEREASLPAG